jgi:hypothetical protein
LKHSRDRPGTLWKRPKRTGRLMNSTRNLWNWRTHRTGLGTPVLLSPPPSCGSLFRSSEKEKSIRGPARNTWCSRPVQPFRRCIHGTFWVSAACTTVFACGVFGRQPDFPIQSASARRVQGGDGQWIIVISCLGAHSRLCDQGSDDAFPTDCVFGRVFGRDAVAFRNREFPGHVQRKSWPDWSRKPVQESLLWLSWPGSRGWGPGTGSGKQPRASS